MTHARTIHIINFFVLCCALGFALFSEHVLKVTPCVLCLYMRWFFAGLILLSVIGIGVKHRVIRIFVIGGLGITIMFAFYQLGVEQKWWKAPGVCSHQTLFSAKTLEDLRESLKHPAPRCDAVNWRVFGISASIWNILLLCVLFLVNAFQKTLIPKVFRFLRFS